MYGSTFGRPLQQVILLTLRWLWGLWLVCSLGLDQEGDGVHPRHSHATHEIDELLAHPVRDQHLVLGRVMVEHFLDGVFNETLG